MGVHLGQRHQEGVITSHYTSAGVNGDEYVRAIRRFKAGTQGQLHVRQVALNRNGHR